MQRFRRLCGVRLYASTEQDWVLGGHPEMPCYAGISTRVVPKVGVQACLDFTVTPHVAL